MHEQGARAVKSEGPSGQPGRKEAGEASGAASKSWFGGGHFRKLLRVAQQLLGCGMRSRHEPGPQAEDGAEVVIGAAATEGEQGGVLEGEQGQAGHQRVGQAEVRAAPLLGELLETTAGTLDQGVKVEVAALPPRGGSLAHGDSSCHTQATAVPSSIVYENGPHQTSFSRLPSTCRELLAESEAPPTPSGGWSHADDADRGR